MIDLANKYDVPIVEDNCYADVHYEGEVEPQYMLWTITQTTYIFALSPKYSAQDYDWVI